MGTPEIEQDSITCWACLVCATCVTNGFTLLSALTGLNTAE
ncbi:subclass IId bacteriocin thuricin17 [Clostridium sp. DL1XJH146]